MNILKDLFSTGPFVFLNANGLFSIVGQFMSLEENVYQTLEAWRTVTRPIWEFFLGWLFEWVGWEMPWWAKDYLTMGPITGASVVRARAYLHKVAFNPPALDVVMFAIEKVFRIIPECLLFWPVLLILFIIERGLFMMYIFLGLFMEGIVRQFTKFPTRI